jgi:membrane associated rhomboid family serine protease
MICAARPRCLVRNEAASLSPAGKFGQHPGWTGTGNAGETRGVFFPISDDDRHLMHPAWITISFVVANVVIFLYQLIDPSFTYGWSVVPYEITRNVDLTTTEILVTPRGPLEIPQAPGPSPIQLTLLSSMFMHAGWMHLGGNMLYLWIFGDNVEHRFGALRFIGFYLVSGLVATAAQIATAPESLIPNLGASGAISGVMGAYLVLFPRNRVNAIFFFRMISVPAFVVLGMWIVLQLFSGAGTLATAGESGGVAYAAHVGGFVAGVVMGLISRLTMKSEPSSVFGRIERSGPKVRRMW